MVRKILKKKKVSKWWQVGCILSVTETKKGKEREMYVRVTNIEGLKIKKGRCGGCVGYESCRANPDAMLETFGECSGRTRGDKNYVIFKRVGFFEKLYLKAVGII